MELVIDIQEGDVEAFNSSANVPLVVIVRVYLVDWHLTKVP